VTEYHSPIIPKGHNETYFDLSAQKCEVSHQFLIEASEKILMRDPSVNGFNIGMNIGKSAGQTIFHCHVHLLPRIKGDISNPSGGVRGVIRNKVDY